jgi:hypothetical protein
MNLLSVLPFLFAMAIVLMVASLLFKSPRQNLKSALTEGAIWGTSSFVAFGAEFLLLIRT